MTNTAESTTKSVSFIVPAHNEAAIIGDCLSSIQDAIEACGLDAEIIVVDDSSSDGTGDIARAAGATVVPVELRHIAAVRNAGARVAQGSRFFFVDGDTLVRTPAVRAALAELDAGAVGGGAAVYFEGTIPWWTRLAMPVFLGLLRLARMAAGCFVYCRRADFEAIGGFDETLFASEEAALSFALGRRGRFVILREHVISSGRKLRTHTLGEMVSVLSRVIWRGGSRRAFGDRDGLDIWYGPRRDDPDESGQTDDAGV